MSESRVSYTPGPWRTDLGDRALYHLHERRLILPPRDAESGAPIAKLPDDVAGVSEANARLIAAAPEMFEALKVAAAAINPSDRSGISLMEWNNRLKAATRAITAAILKAERGY